MDSLQRISDSFVTVNSSYCVLSDVDGMMSGEFSRYNNNNKVFLGVLICTNKYLLRMQSAGIS